MLTAAWEMTGCEDKLSCPPQSQFQGVSSPPAQCPLFSPVIVRTSHVWLQYPILVRSNRPCITHCLHCYIACCCGERVLTYSQILRTVCRVLSIAHHPVPALRGSRVGLEDSLSSKKVEAHSRLTKEEMVQGKKASE